MIKKQAFSANTENILKIDLWIRSGVVTWASKNRHELF